MRLAQAGIRNGASCFPGGLPHDHFVNALEETGGGKRFFNQHDARIELATAADCFGRVAGHIHHFLVRVSAPELVDHFGATHERHNDIRNDQVHLFGLTETLQAFNAVAGGEDLEPGLCEGDIG